MQPVPANEEKTKQDRFNVSERNGQLVIALNNEIILPESASVRLTSAWPEALNYKKLCDAYFAKRRESKADPWAQFKVMVYGYQCGIYSAGAVEKSSVAAFFAFQATKWRDLAQNRASVAYQFFCDRGFLIPDYCCSLQLPLYSALMQISLKQNAAESIANSLSAREVSKPQKKKSVGRRSA